MNGPERRSRHNNRDVDIIVTLAIPVVGLILGFSEMLGQGSTVALLTFSVLLFLASLFGLAHAWVQDRHG